MQYFQYDDIDASYQLKRNIKQKALNVRDQVKPSILNKRLQNHFGNRKEQSVHLITKTIDTMKRLVHLDLKGSQPKLTYLAELIPYFKQVGATGVLIEYEDFFPYEHDLESIRNQNHYTKQEINQIFVLFKESNLNVIPLIQTYGHLEFVLKLKQFSYLREDPNHFQAITPCLKDSYDKLLFLMIDQILENHPDDLEYIHIGCDEVYLMNKNPACEKIEGSNDFRSQDWFILHITKIVEYIKSKRPHLNVMIWDDMIRKALSKDSKPNEKMMKFAKTVVPMVWDYHGQLEIENHIWKSYDNMFSEIWFASAFKGATNHLELMPNITKHYNNQLSWLNAITIFPNPLKIKGIAFTGWSRFDHMQSVCEILPAAIPSLAICLQAFINYDMDENIVFSKSKDLTECNFNDSSTGFILDPYSLILDKNMRNKEIEYTCNFPGSNIYQWILKLKLLLQKFEFRYSKYSQILNDYNMKNKFFNTIIYEKALIFYQEVRDQLKAIESNGEKEFDKFYYSDLYEEIVQVYIIRYVDLIDKQIAELSKIKLPEAAPNRPFNKINLNFV